MKVKVRVPSQVSGLGLFRITGPVGVIAPAQASMSTGGKGAMAKTGQATVEAPLAGRGGGVTSCTVMERAQEAVLPQPSVAVQVRVRVKVPGQLPGTVTSLKVTLGPAVQLSVAVGGVKTGVAGQLIGVVCAAQVMVGGVLSIRVM